MQVSAGKTLLKRQGFSDSDPLNDWLLAAWYQFEEAHDWPFLTVDVDLAVSAMNNEATTPSDFFKVLSLRDDTVAMDTLDKVDFRTYERTIADPFEVGTPSIYTTIGTTKLVFWAVADVPISLHVIYQKSLDVWTADNQELPGPARAHYVVVQIAKAIALQDENEEQRAQSAQAQSEAALDRLWDKYSGVDSSDGQDQVQDVMGYGG